MCQPMRWPYFLGNIRNFRLTKVNPQLFDLESMRIEMKSDGLCRQVKRYPDVSRHAWRVHGVYVDRIPEPKVNMVGK